MLRKSIFLIWKASYAAWGSSLDTHSSSSSSHNIIMICALQVISVIGNFICPHLVAKTCHCGHFGHISCVCSAVSRLSIRLAGSALGHEHQIMQYLQHFLQHSVNLDILSEGSHEPAAATILVHRMKPRLPSDEIQALLASVQGT